MQTAQKNYTLPIIMMFFLFAMIAFVTGFQNPFGVILKDQLSLSNLQSQIGNAANFIAYAFMGLPAGILLERKGYKVSAIAAIVVGIIGVALMFLSSTFSDPDTIFGIYIAGAFVAGFSMCMLNTVVNPMLNSLGGGGKKGNQLIQFGGTCNSLAATICPVLVGYLVGNSAKTLVEARPALYIAGGIFLFALIVIALTKIPEPGLEAYQKEAKAEKPALFDLFGFRHYVLGIIAIFFYIAIEVGIPNIANLYMVNDCGIDTALAGSICGMYWFLMLCGRFIGGAIGGKISSRVMLTCVSSLGILFMLLAIMLDPAQTIQMPGISTQLTIDFATVPVNILFLVLCGLCTSVMWGGIFNLAVEGLGKYTAVASGFFMVMVCGGFLTMIQGAIADAVGYLPSYWMLFALLAYMLFYALVGSKVTRRADA